ncbi:MAG: MBL fold metallo-hydrolase [Candidatus Moraniibacteriota bacterium]
MSKQKIYSSLLFLLLLVGIITASVFWFDAYQKTTEITFLSVGEGDSILLSQGSNQILIDGGRTGKDLLSRLGRHVPFWDRTIEVVIATHPDADHIGGLSALLNSYTVKQFLYTGAESKTDVYALLKKSLEANHVDIQKIFRGGTVQFPVSGNLSVEYPLTVLPSEMAEANTGSIVVRFSYGETSMLFTGDLPSEENVIGDIAPVDILKVSHHGSRFSTSATFLEQLNPKEAIISVGKNMYGHPSPDVLKRLEERNVTVRRTDQSGDIRYRCTDELNRCIFVE